MLGQGSHVASLTSSAGAVDLGVEGKPGKGVRARIGLSGGLLHRWHSEFSILLEGSIGWRLAIEVGTPGMVRGNFRACLGDTMGIMSDWSELGSMGRLGAGNISLSLHEA